MSKILEIAPILRVHAKSRAFARRLSTLRARLESLDPARCYASFSAGKDSAVVAHAAQAWAPGIPILMVDPGVPTHWTEAERAAWIDYAARAGWDLHLFPWDKWGEQGIRAATDAASHARAAHQSMFRDLRAWADGHGRDIALIGIRAEESRGRKLAAYRSRGVFEFSAWPIWDWSSDDVWAYILSNDLPWLSIYEHLGPDARNGLIGRNGVESGRMAYLRRYYPDAYRHARDNLGLEYTL
jgi:phosphoadenosine phosphosulfate reductase